MTFTIWYTSTLLYGMRNFDTITTYKQSWTRRIWRFLLKTHVVIIYLLTNDWLILIFLKRSTKRDPQGQKSRNKSYIYIYTEYLFVQYLILMVYYLEVYIRPIYTLLIKHSDITTMYKQGWMRDMTFLIKPHFTIIYLLTSDWSILTFINECNTNKW